VSATTRGTVTVLPPLPKAIGSPAEAAERATEVVSVSHAVGRIAGEFVWAYPPDIPILVPGEEIDEAMIVAFTSLQEKGVRLHSDSEGLPRTVKVSKN
jgi:arginine/lysine/ornithine decarboxylase